MDVLTQADLAIFSDADAEQIAAITAELNAQAVRIAPCLADPANADQRLIARGILRDVALRRMESGAGGFRSRSHSVPPFSESIVLEPNPRRMLMWPSEITALEELCADARRGVRARSGWNI